MRSRAAATTPQQQHSVRSVHRMGIVTLDDWTRETHSSCASSWVSSASLRPLVASPQAGAAQHSRRSPATHSALAVRKGVQLSAISAYYARSSRVLAAAVPECKLESHNKCPLDLRKGRQAAALKLRHGRRSRCGGWLAELSRVRASAEQNALRVRSDHNCCTSLPPPPLCRRS